MKIENISRNSYRWCKKCLKGERVEEKKKKVAASGGRRKGWSKYIRKGTQMSISYRIGQSVGNMFFGKKGYP